MASRTAARWCCATVIGPSWSGGSGRPGDRGGGAVGEDRAALAADGVANQVIAERVRGSRPMVNLSSQPSESRWVGWMTAVPHAARSPPAGPDRLLSWRRGAGCQPESTGTRSARPCHYRGHGLDRGRGRLHGAGVVLPYLRILDGAAGVDTSDFSAGAVHVLAWDALYANLYVAVIGVLAVVIALTAFRRGDRWAWFAMAVFAFAGIGTAVLDQFAWGGWYNRVYLWVAPHPRRADRRSANAARARLGVELGGGSERSSAGLSSCFFSPCLDPSPAVKGCLHT